VSVLLKIFALAALLCALAALWKPRLYPFKNPTRLKSAAFYLAIFFFCLLVSGSFAPAPTPEEPLPAMTDGLASPPSGGVLAWEEISRVTVPSPANGRDRLIVTIMPAEDQTGARQQELLTTATGVAVKTQKETGAPVVLVILLCQRAENAFGEPPLAQAVYIPDGKGFDGADEGAPEPWESLQAAQRGFSKRELEYLAHRAAMYKEFQGHSGLREKELDEAISRLMGVNPGSLNPMNNAMLEVAPGVRP
jgi:hypothetical protein